MNSHSKSISKKIQRLGLITGAILIVSPLLWLGWLNSRRPHRSNQNRQLFHGINYQRIVRNQPRPLLIHIVSIDLNESTIKPIITPPENSQSNHTIARTTSQFLQDFKVQLAINGSFFQPFQEKTPWDYYPRSGDRVFPIGQTIANHRIYSLSRPGWSVLCFNSNNFAQIIEDEKCPINTIYGIAGNQILVLNGQTKLNPDPRENKPYPRVAVGIDRTGRKLLLVAVDGKQPLYSEGLTSNEMAKLMVELKTDTALNLDGGGSTTLAIQTPSGIEVLNAPIHTKIPNRERPVANHLGFFARTLSAR